MTTQNRMPVPHSVDVGSKSAHTNPDKEKSLTDEEREHIFEYYRSLNFKEFLAACPIEGIDLTREPEYPRDVEL